MTSPARFMLVAGEASGDQYGARVVCAIRAQLPDAEFFGIGGDRMTEAGVELLYHTRQTSIMGFIEVAKNYRFLRSVFRRCEQELANRKPEVVILVDYPGFNLRFARKARAAGARVLYYISPQVWAWGSERAGKMKALVDHLAVVFPFEEAIYWKLDVPVSFVGHPLLEILEKTQRRDFLVAAGLPDAPILALLPGSRTQEIERMLPLMLAAGRILRDRTGCTLAIGASHLPDSAYAPFLANRDAVLLRGMTHGLMEHARAAIVTSGTATVETAFYKTPFIIVYRTSALNYAIGRRLVQVEHIGMPNILAGRKIVPELLQSEVTVDALVAQMLPLLTDEKARDTMIADLAAMRASMGDAGASARVADIAVSLSK